jgi:hypothetical protein
MFPPAPPARRNAPERLSRSPALRAARGKISAPTDSARALLTDPDALAYDPADIDTLYSMPVGGDVPALGINRGGRLVMSSLEEPRVADVVAVWWRPELTPRGESQAMLLRLLAPVPVCLPYDLVIPQSMQAMLLVSNLIESGSCYMLARHLLAVHRCIGWADADGRTVRWEGGAA